MSFQFGTGLQFIRGLYCDATDLMLTHTLHHLYPYIAQNNMHSLRLPSVGYVANWRLIAPVYETWHLKQALVRV